MNDMIKDLPKFSQVSFRKLNTFSTFFTVMERIYENNKMKCNLFVLVDNLNIELYIYFSDVFFCYTNLFFTDVIFN